MYNNKISSTVFEYGCVLCSAIGIAHSIVRVKELIEEHKKQNARLQAMKDKHTEFTKTCEAVQERVSKTFSHEAKMEAVRRFCDNYNRRLTPIVNLLNRANRLLIEAQNLLTQMESQYFLPPWSTVANFRNSYRDLKKEYNEHEEEFKQTDASLTLELANVLMSINYLTVKLEDVWNNGPDSTRGIFDL